MTDTLQTIERISGVNPRKCMKCGKCTATCPAFDKMQFHPHQFVDMVQTGRIQALLDSPGIYHCMSCLACVQRCPRSVEPAAIIEAVRVSFLRRQDCNHLKPQEIIPKLDPQLPQQAITAALRKYGK